MAKKSSLYRWPQFSFIFVIYNHGLLEEKKKEFCSGRKQGADAQLIKPIQIKHPSFRFAACRLTLLPCLNAGPS